MLPGCRPHHCRRADADGHGCAEWWHQGLSRQGLAVEFVGGSSSVLAVGGRCTGGNIALWDTIAPTGARVLQEQSCPRG